MPPSLRLRLMTAADLDFADSLRALAGWNQTRSDWQRLLELAPDGCFLAELNGAPAGTATTTCYGNDVAWIGMVLVHPDYRRRGIGSALLQHCLDHLRQRHIACIKLDATPLGKPVYEKLGFQTGWPLRRWEAAKIRQTILTATDRIRPWANSDSRAIQPLDQQAFGVARPRLLAKLVNDSRQALVHTAATGELIGYGLLREGSRADYLGPVVAATSDAGVNLCLALLDSQLSTPNPQPIYWDIPDANSAATDLSQQLGFTPQRPFLRMFLGENKHPGDSLKQFSIAGPEIG